MNIGTLRPLVIAPAADHLGHRQLPLAAIDASAGRAEHHVVACRPPVGLLGELHIKAMFGKEAFLHPDHQGGGFEDGQEAEADGLGVKSGAGRSVWFGGWGVTSRATASAVGGIAEAAAENNGGG
jgi:hypothetical protein